MCLSEKPKTYLVTGCAGFIASRVAHLLLEAGHRIVGVDNMNDYYDVSLKEYRLTKLRQFDRFEFHKFDLENREAVTRLFDQYSFDAVLSLAGRAGVRYSMIDPVVYLATNAMANLYILEEMKNRGIKKYVLASTSSLYSGQQLPFHESLAVNTPITSYAASKKAAEVMAYSYHHLYGIDVSIVRYFTVYGPAGRPDMSYFRFIKWIDEDQPIVLYGDGTQARDFTFIDDIAGGTIAALQPVGYEIINLGGGKQPISMITIIRKLESLLGKKANIEYRPFHKADVLQTWADISKANRILDWRPKVRIDEGLERCVQWHCKNLPWSAEIELGESAGKVAGMPTDSKELVLAHEEIPANDQLVP